MLILATVVAAGVALGTIPPLMSWARARGLLDVPNERSSHRVPTPRVGGLAIVAAVCAGLGVATTTGSAVVAHGGALAGGALAVATLSLVDDVRSLSALLRLAGHVAIAAAVVAHLGPWPLLEAVPFVSMVLAVVWIVGLVNAYNFMDGIDGLAGGQAVVAALGWAVVGAVTGAPALTAVGLVVAGAAAGFLRFNWPPARVFMGDAGSAFLGFTFAAVPFAEAASPRLLATAALFVWPFLFDTIVTFVRRLARGENVVKAHRTHLYQRLVSTGLSHRRVSLTYLGLAALGLPAGISMAAGPWSLTGLLVVVVAAAAGALWRTAARREAATARPVS